MLNINQVRVWWVLSSCTILHTLVDMSGYNQSDKLILLMFPPSHRDSHSPYKPL